MVCQWTLWNLFPLIQKGKGQGELLSRYSSDERAGLTNFVTGQKAPSLLCDNHLSLKTNSPVLFLLETQLSRPFPS